MFIIYDIVFILAGIFYLPYAFLKGKWHSQFATRLGFFSDEFVDTLKSRQNIWIHAVSVGEVQAVIALIEKMKRVYPQHRIVISTVTATGNHLAKQKLLKDGGLVIFAPFDLSFVVRKYIRIIQPKLYITCETEIWPNTFMFLKKNNVPIIIVNGRISDKSFKGYRKLKPLLNFKDISSFCVQTKLDADRFFELGAPIEKIKIIGNLKYDILVQKDSISKVHIGWPEGCPVLIAGSTHSGEEEVFLDLFLKLKNSIPELRVIIAPRHIERASDVERMAQQRKVETALFDQVLTDPSQTRPVIIVNTIGHLAGLYNLADVIFVGKSLTASGGQNVIEPASFAKPVIVGPNTSNFRDVISAFMNRQAIIQVQTKEELLEQVEILLKNKERCETLGRLAKEVVQSFEGATQKTLEEIKKVAGNL